MKRHDSVIGSRTGLRMMMFSVRGQGGGRSSKRERGGMTRSIAMLVAAAGVGTYCSRGKVIADRRNYLVR